MTFPGYGAVILGVSIAMVLYYMFASNEQEQPQQQQRQRQQSNRTSSNISTNFDNNYHRWSNSRNDIQSRRRSSSVAAYHGECSICLNYIAASSKIQLQPCKHIFHAGCIRKWMANGPLDSRYSCPNCRCAIPNNL